MRLDPRLAQAVRECAKYDRRSVSECLYEAVHAWVVKRYYDRYDAITASAKVASLSARSSPAE